jgi:hypothetical protein
MKGVSQKVDSEEGVTESESDDSESEESGEHESDHDCEVIGGKETAIAHEELLLNSSSLLRRKWTKSAKYRYVMSKAGVRPSKQMEGEGEMSSRTQHEARIDAFCSNNFFHRRVLQ